MDKPVKVAILDTGVNSPSVESKVISKQFVKDSKKDNNHGNDIAKIIEFQNKIVIYDAKVLNNDGLGTVENTIAGIDWAIKNKVNVINMSYGFTQDYQKFHKKIKEANNKGIIILAANGNDIFGQKEYPASYKET
ncbi:S8 family serine peptidase, partial [Mammaliicoccus fleurettii]|nr:S8 family serine peptidase [Mammaliicoccus fleurettii]